MRRERRRRRSLATLLVLLVAVVATLLVTAWLALREPPVPAPVAVGAAAALRR